MQPMDRKIQSVIKKYSYPMWLIIQDTDVDCTCVDFTTKQADPNCKKCLGTGHKIMLRHINMAHQNSRVSIKGNDVGTSEYTIFPVFYALTDAKCKMEDLVIDGEGVFVVQHYYAEHSNESSPVYYKIEAMPKKNNAPLLLKNFKELIRGAGYE